MNVEVGTDHLVEIDIVVTRETVESVTRIIEMVVIVATYVIDEIVEITTELGNGQEVSEDHVVLLGVDWTEIEMIDINAPDRCPEVDVAGIIDIQEIMIETGRKMVRENVMISSKTLCPKGLKWSIQIVQVKKILKILILRKRRTKKLLSIVEGSRGKNC